MKCILIFAAVMLNSMNCIAGWTVQNSGTQADLFDVIYLTETTGFAAGGKVGDEYGIILRTTNSGQTWDSIYGGSRLLRGIAFTDINTGFVVGNTGTILRTTNGGANWSQINSGTTQHLRSVSFPPTATGFTGFICGFSGMMLKTENGGANWAIQQTGVTKVLFSVHFYDGVNGISVGGDNSLGDQPVIIKTTNGGINWTSQVSPLPFALRGVFMLDQSNAFAAGNENALIKSNNGGANWNSISLPGSRYLRDVFFVNDQLGYVCGNSGCILNTTNGGSSWDTAAALTSRYLEAIHFINQNNGSAVGHSGTILKYTFTTSAHSSNSIGSSFELHQNFPNPFNPVTNIQYTVSASARVKLEVFDVLGIRVAAFEEGYRQPGEHTIIFDGSKLPSGTYFYRITAESANGEPMLSETKLMTILK